MAVIAGEPLPPPQIRPGTGGSARASAVLDNIIPIFIGLIVLGKILQSLFGRFIGASVMSVAVGFIGWVVFSSVIFAIIIAVLSFFVSLFGNAGGGIARGGPGDWPGGGFGRAEVVVALGAEVVSVEVAVGLAAVVHRGDGK